MAQTSSGSHKYLQVVRSWIVNGDFEPGEPLREDHLADRLAASRTTVRKLLSVIQHEELVVYSPNQGYRVRRLDHTEIQQRLRVRAALEGLVCRVIADCGADKSLQLELAGALKDCLSFGKRAPRAQAAMQTYQAAVKRFHDALYAACNNEFLVSSLAACSLVPVFTQSGWRWLEHEQYVTNHLPDIIVAANVDRARVLEAIVGGESTRAETLMREHYFMVSQGLRRLFESGVALGPKATRHTVNSST